jgi:two-component system, cell cycle sensor histidine kinase and response regulator CckA
MEKSLLKDLLIGKYLRIKMLGGDIEYRRKAMLLIILNYLAIVMLAAFASLSLIRGDHVHASINAAILLLVFLGFLRMRLRGNLSTGAYLIIVLLCLQFLSDFRSDINRAMWSFTIPVICFFLLGARRGTVCVSIYWALAVLSMGFPPAKNYPLDFKIRFLAIFFCVTFFSYFFEKVRQQTQKLLQKSHLRSRIQRDIALALGEEEDMKKALNRVFEIVVRIETVDCGGIYFVDRNSGALALFVHRGLSDEFIKAVSFFPADSQNTRLVMKGTPVYSQHRGLGIPVSGEGKKENLKAFALLPIQNRGNVVAVMNLASHVHGEIPMEIRSLLESITVNIGNAISRLITIRDLHELSSRNDAILAAVPDIIMQVDTNKVYTWANKAGYVFFGEDVIGKPADFYFEGEQDTYLKVEPVFSGNEEVIYIESWQRRKDGAKRLLAWWCRVLKDESGAAVGALSSARDVTESRSLEDQFRQAQKMEAVGQLAGGVAHDFNNQLSIISGFAELIRDKVTDDATISRYADNILLTAKRSADLAGQLLAFSRKGKFRSVPIDVHTIISEVVNILKHTIDRKITIRQQLNASPAVITGDPTQLQNALLNIALNARDAMPEGGDLIFATECAVLDKSYYAVKKYVIAPGRYVRISVTDSGFGMDAETQSHLFEPFFTTKEKGKGTGMGLPAVYGIVKNHKGAINVYSESGHGTTVKLYLPAAEAEAGETIVEAPKAPATDRKLNILFVDDEEMMREMAQEMLQVFGHSVLLSENGQAAVELYKESFTSIDLVILDIIMPVMGGRAAFGALRRINPAVRVILSSGYSINEEAQQIIDEGALGFVQKPFTSSQIAEAIRKAFLRC